VNVQASDAFYLIHFLLRSMLKLHEIDLRIISELTKNAKTSDRTLARTLGVSQPTITRRRARLEREGFLSYKTVPNFWKLGAEIVAFTLIVFKRLVHEHDHEKEDCDHRLMTFLSKQPNIVFASSGQGLGMTRIIASVHKDYSDYVKFISLINEQWGTCLERDSSFIVSLNSDQIQKQFSFEHVIDYLHPENVAQ
jgi:DNA-binding Lrp family transcriptional regulator